MALIVCPECGNQISDKAATCPHCGAPVEDLVEDGEIVFTWMPNHHFEGARRTTVFVDGRQVAILKCRESISVPVDGGVHAIELWQGKHKILVDTVEIKRSSPQSSYKFKETDQKGNLLTHPHPDLVKYEEHAPQPHKNVPRCPTCGSEKIRKLSMLGKAVSFDLVGFAGKSLNKTFKCKNCGYTW